MAASAPSEGIRQLRTKQYPISLGLPANGMSPVSVSAAENAARSDDLLSRPNPLTADPGVVTVQRREHLAAEGEASVMAATGDPTIDSAEIGRGDGRTLPGAHAGPGQMSRPGRDD